MEFDLQDDQPSINQIANTKINIGQQISHKTENRFDSQTIGKGIIETQQNLDIKQQASKQPLIIKKQQDFSLQDSSKKRKKKHMIKLEPLQNNKKIQVFKNIIPQIQQDQEIELFEPEKKEILQKQQQQLNEEDSESEKSVGVKNIKKIAQNLLFFDDGEEQDDKKTDQQISDSNQDIQIPKNQLGNPLELEDEDEISIIENSNKYFKFEHFTSFKHQFYQPVRQNTILRMQLIRDNSIFKTFWPQFHLNFVQDKHNLISAKKTSSKPCSTFIISSNMENFQQNSQFYFGKIKSNLLGDTLNVFNGGLNPSNAKQKNTVPRQMLASIVYLSNNFEAGKPRQFEVYVLKSDYRYYHHFPQVKMYGEQIPLSQLYKKSENQNKIDVYRNRKPVWSESIKGFMLNFKGRVKIASIKNFILQKKEEGAQNDIVLFGKVEGNRYNIDISAPASPIVAFAIALTTFDTRLIGQ